MLSQNKITETKTGTLFYTRLKDNSGGYRVRFRSFQQGLLENREKQEELTQLEINYNYFKYGKSQSRKLSTQEQRRPVTKQYKNMRDRSRDNQELRTRLKSMRENRRSIFEKIKSIKE